MIVYRKSEEVEKEVLAIRKTEKKIGFVPTMGALHQGHLSLVEHSEKENDFNIVSIFVNPTQFNNSADLEKYPRTELADLKLLEEIGCDAVFIPTVDEIYPNGSHSEKFDFNGLEFQMEGKFRPGHFDGVGTVVKRLFGMIKPDNAYFGEKDFQQLRIIQQMVNSEKMNVRIVPVPIKREKDGLAMSSRNLRLTAEMRNEAPLIYKILKESKDYFKNHSVKETEKFAKKRFDQTALRLEYFEIADEETLESAHQNPDSKHLRAFVAAFAGDIRLIDNLRIK
ncbi:MAG: pantoate--beta-alanine ligase [Moheibacter sp.]